MCGVGNVEIWLTYKGNGAMSDTTIDQGPWYDFIYLFQPPIKRLRVFSFKDRYITNKMMVLLK